MTTTAPPTTFKTECDRYLNETWRVGISTNLVSRESGARFQAGWFIFYATMIALFVVIFAFYKFAHPSRGRFGRIQHRPFVYLVITHFGAVLTGLVCSFYQSRPVEEGIPCWLILTAYFFQVPCLVFPLVARLLAFYREAQWTAAVVLTSGNMEREAGNQRPSRTSQYPSSSSPGINKPQGGNNVSTKTEGGGGGGDDYTSVVLNHSRKSVCDTIMHMGFCKRIKIPKSRQHQAAEVVSQAVAAAAIDAEGGGGGALDTETNAQSTSERLDLRMLRFLKSDFGSYLTMFIVFTPFMITLFVALGVSPLVKLNCTGCYPNLTDELVLTIETVLAVIILISCFALNRKRRDPFGIVNEVRMVVWLGGVPAVVLNIVNNSTRNNEFASRDFQLTILIEASLLVYCFVQSVLQVILALNDRSKESIAVEQVVYNLKEFEQDFIKKDGRFREAFANYLIFEHGYESVAFLSSVYQWEKDFFDVSPNSCRARARKIVHMYVGDRAELPCNLSGNCVKSIQSALHRQDEDLKFDFFREAKDEIINMLHRDSFRRFVRSPEYMRVLKMNNNNKEITTHVNS